MPSKARTATRARSELSAQVKCSVSSARRRERPGPSSSEAWNPLEHEVRGLEAAAADAGRGPGGGGAGGPGGLLELVVVGEGLGEPVGRVDAQGVVEAGQFERGAQVADGGAGCGEQGRAAEFVQDAGVRLRAGRFGEGAAQAAAGGVGGSDGEVLDGGGAQLPDDVLVVVRVDFEEVS